MTFRRRYVVNTALFWLPVGLGIAPLVLLLAERGLTPGTVAGVVAVHSFTAAALELPTGGLSDVVGRRGVLAAAGLLMCAAFLLIALGGTAVVLGIGTGLLGAARALSSGPAEAWYVDSVRASEGPAADLRTGLARGATASSVALAVGTVAGGALPWLLGGYADDLRGATGGTVLPLSTPMLLAALSALGYTAHSLLALHETPHRRQPLDAAHPAPHPLLDAADPEPRSLSDAARPDLRPPLDGTRPDSRSLLDTAHPAPHPLLDAAAPEPRSLSDAPRPDPHPPLDPAPPAPHPLSDAARPDPRPPLDGASREQPSGPCPPLDGTPRKSPTLRAIPATILGGLRLAAQDAIVRRVLLSAAAAGSALAVVELLVPGRVAGVTGGAESGAVGYAGLATVGFLCSAGGSQLAALVGGGRRGVVVGTGVLAGALALLALGGDAVAVVGYGAFYVTLGVLGPGLNELLHHRVPDDRRATALSVQSLSLQLAAGVTGLIIGPFATAGALPWLLPIGAVLAVALLWALPPRKVTAQQPVSPVGQAQRAIDLP
ncbi:MFS transporter [Streptomyces sp. 4F14]|uniref:MFS transporter n=1 Tax=Streptomyces sp. 4F14 TaxID=3394380 RepID=UPI003A893B62